jgi:hypothetical protein
MRYKTSKSTLLRIRLKKSNGYLLKQRINQFYLTTYIFDKNFTELTTHIEKQVEPINALRLNYYEQRKELEILQLETLRFLHNYITSAISLIDHTRIYINELYSGNKSFLAEYQNKIDNDFTNNPLAVFIKSFRQYIQHYQTPFISTVSNLTDNPEELNTRIVISKEDLLLFSGWKSLAKGFIIQLEKDLDINLIIHQYHNLVKEFYKWFQIRQTELHKADFEEMEEINQKMLIAQIEELTYAYIDNENYKTNDFIKEICRYMGDFEKKVFENADKHLQFEYIKSILKKNNIVLSKKELIEFKIKYNR